MRHFSVKEEAAQPYKIYLGKEVAVQTENDHTII